ncbi:NAD-dependent SIR2 family protein deacetylase [Psychromicrobium silvestre]|uniref:protein acetyllysine N-acetyltransferase n=1 Tax=Psychromicrobium silvestre TaxID=1645614 RepID=A0A7Y9LS46_9MICC|nr:Sir2 family NAD-dependent protein deacetylase [Psychromicrobium silvestre]NYE94585.1 NAD-dependent SIR2 family protein deacetylase [Psychromicrobium silvestre]
MTDRGTAGRPGLGLMGFVSGESAGETAELSASLRQSLDGIAELIGGAPIAVLTGAGLSTDSGIPDYRGPGAPERNPLTYQQFTGDEELRRRYWARNQLGWRHLRRASPNAGHFAVAALESRGLSSGIITQNVDRLHEEAGALNVVDLHGRFDRVVCLSCRTEFSRDSVAELMEEFNPDFVERAEASGRINLAPDADAELDDAELIGSFLIAPCPVCGGTLKPDFVFFGENVPKDRVERSFQMLEEASALLVAGSSLTVMSGLRFPRRAVKDGKSVVIINRGATRGDDLASIKLEAGASESLSYLARALPDLPSRYPDQVE